MDTRAKLRDFILSNFMLARSHQDLSDSDSLFGKGVLDSTAVLELVGFVEETFEISVDDEELIPGNLDTIDNPIGYIERKKAYADTSVS